MKTFFTYIFLFITFSSFGQTKEDVLTCLDLIFSQDELESAFNNDVTSNGEVVIIVKGRSNYNAPEIQKIKDQLTQDDFYSSDHQVKIIQGNSDQLRRLGIPEIYTLSLSIGGDEEELAFMMKTQIKGENQRADWVYRLKKTEEEWEIIGSDMRKTKSVVNENGF